VTARTLPQKLSTAVPRRVEPRGIVFAYVALGVVLAVIMPIFLTFDAYQQSKMDAALAARGLTTAGSFDAFLQTRATKNGQRFDKIRYNFSAGSDGSPVVGEAWVTDAFYATLRSQPQIDVVYDSAHPEVSRPVYAGMELTRVMELKTMVLWSVAADAAALIFIVALPIRRALRDLWLLRWGLAAPARIASKSVGTGRSGNYLALNYEFVDESGQKILGRRVIWGNITANGRTNDPRIRAALENPTVLYDRNDSRRNLLYPSTVADIRR
jgi:hypothetical protein